MSDKELLLELEQHKVSGLLHWFTLDRRDFLKVFGGGLLVCAAAPSVLGQESGRTRAQQQLPKDLNSWLHIAPDGKITVMTGKVEMGQNIRTSLAQAVSEELRAPFEQITMLMGDTDLVPWDAGTFGSRTTPTMSPVLREVAITARELLLDTAAQKWSADRSKLVADNGRITDPASKKSATYGELTNGEKLMATVTDPPETPPTAWRVMGTSKPKVNGRDFVTGRHQYTSDLSRPGMLFGKVLRPPSFGAEITSLDTKQAQTIPGVTVVSDGNFIGVTAPDSETAEHALKLINANWSEKPGPSNANLFQYLKDNEENRGRGGDTRPAPSSARQTGDVDKAIAAAPVKLERTYTVQYIAHTPLEPRAAVAEWSGDKLTVWTGTQRPFGVRDELVETFRVPPEKVRVLVPDTGAAYGGKHQGDAAIEAARLAKAAGKPVKLVWTREEEFTWAYFRPGGVIDVRSAVNKDGTIVAWEFHNWNSGPAGIEPQYNIANTRVQFHPSKSPLRQGSYRALAATANNFARESHIDELANAIGMDPLQFRLKNLTEPRVTAVLKAAAEKFQWPRKSTSSVGYGMACGTEKGGFYAAFAEVETQPTVRVRRIVEAFECGAVVNPNGLQNQVEGSIVQGLGGALFEAIQFANGKILNAHMNSYRVPRFRDLPQIDVVIVDRKDLPSSGAGEATICPVAPAIANAIFASTGVRVRHMPMSPGGNVQA